MIKTATFITVLILYSMKEKHKIPEYSFIRGEYGRSGKSLYVEFEKGVKVVRECFHSLLYEIFLRRQTVTWLLLHHVTDKVLEI